MIDESNCIGDLSSYLFVFANKEDVPNIASVESLFSRF